MNKYFLLVYVKVLFKFKSYVHKQLLSLSSIYIIPYYYFFVVIVNILKIK